jgi:hypothetical protein
MKVRGVPKFGVLRCSRPVGPGLWRDAGVNAGM